MEITNECSENTIWLSKDFSTLSKKSGEKSHVVLVIKIIQENGTTVYSRVDVDVQPCR